MRARLCVCLFGGADGFDGHHGTPKSPPEINKADKSQSEHAMWRHIEPSAGAYSAPSLNRVRLGDLMAMLGVYFQCDWAVGVLRAGDGAMSLSILGPLIKRGFSFAEPMTRRAYLACERRGLPSAAAWLGSAKWHHPGTGGSYTPHTLPESLTDQVRRGSNRMKSRKAMYRYEQGTTAYSLGNCSSGFFGPSPAQSWSPASGHKRGDKFRSG